MNDGPGFTQNISILSACSELIICLSNRSFIPFAPTGYPPIILNKNTDTAFLGMNKIFDIGKNVLPINLYAPEFIIIDEKNINENSEGTKIFMHILIPSLTPSCEISGYLERKTPKRIINSEYVKETLFLMVKILKIDRYELMISKLCIDSGKNSKF